MGVYRSPWESMGVHRSPLWESLGVHNRRGGDETDEFQRFLLRGVNGSPWGLGSPESMGVEGGRGESRESMEAGGVDGGPGEDRARWGVEGSPRESTGVQGSRGGPRGVENGSMRTLGRGSTAARGVYRGQGGVYRSTPP